MVPLRDYPAGPNFVLVSAHTNTSPAWQGEFGCCNLHSPHAYPSRRHRNEYAYPVEEDVDDEDDEDEDEVEEEDRPVHWDEDEVSSYRKCFATSNKMACSKLLILRSIV